MAYLDDTGLAYFWGKIKAWANSVFALISHTHPASDVTLMTGYSKPASGSAIAASDTLNQAVGKLEAKVDVAIDDSNYVHLTGDETIAGKKAFIDDVFATKYIYIKQNSVTYGTAPSENLYRDICFVDSINNRLCWIESTQYPSGGSRLHMGINSIVSNIGNYSANINLVVTPSGRTTLELITPEFQRNVAPSADSHCWAAQIKDRGGTNTLGGIYYTYNTDKTTSTRLMCYNGTNTSGSSWSYLGVGYDSSGNSYTYAPTPSANSNDANIATTAWVTSKGYLTSHQSLANYVTLNGTQTITGTKTFSKDITLSSTSNASGGRYLTFHNSSLTKGSNPSADTWHGVLLEDKNGDTLVSLNYIYYSDHSAAMRFTCYSDASHSEGMYFTCYPSGTVQFRPNTNGLVQLGTSGKKFKEIWCTQSSINSSSDERIKTKIGSIPDNVLDAWESIEWVQYKFIEAEQKKNENARYHTGAIAQRIGKAFSDKGLDASRYGLYLYDEWEAEQEERDDKGNVVQSAMPAGDAYGLRYVEALCMEAAYMRRENARLKKRVANLEDRLAALELRLGSE